MDTDVQAAILRVLAQFPKVHIAYLFGSAARNCLTSTSDVDIAVAADTRLPLETRLALAAQMAQALHREVDLIKLLWFDQSDMMPYRRRILAERRRRFVHG